MNQGLGEKQQVFRSRIDKSGRIAIPAELRSEFGLSAGSSVLIIRDDAGVHLETPEQALHAIQDYFGTLVPSGVSLVDELIAERREEAAREARE